LDVGYQISDIGATIQQFIQFRHDFLSHGGVTLQGGVPLARGRLKLPVNFAKFLLKIFLGGFEARFQRGKVAS